uniref:Uncharacterized protein n=1 Tax=Cercocebus atys TaxID=9531 RepID=A0A2K5M821_CERAT
MGKKSPRKGPAPHHADGKLGRTCKDPYAPWGFTPASLVPKAWPQKHRPEPAGLPTAVLGAALPPALRLRDTCPRSVRGRAKQQNIHAHLSGAPILLPELEGTKLSNFQESSPLPHKRERKDKGSTQEEEGRSAPEKSHPVSEASPRWAQATGCRLSYNLPPGMLLSVWKCCMPSSFKNC